MWVRGKTQSLSFIPSWWQMGSPRSLLKFSFYIAFLSPSNLITTWLQFDLIWFGWGGFLCSFAWVSLRFLGLWVDDHHFLWKILNHDVMKYLFSVPQCSPLLPGSQLHLCETAGRGALTLLPAFPGAFLLVSHLGQVMSHFLQVPWFFLWGCLLWL